MVQRAEGARFLLVRVCAAVFVVCCFVRAGETSPGEFSLFCTRERDFSDGLPRSGGCASPPRDWGQSRRDASRDNARSPTTATRSEANPTAPASMRPLSNVAGNASQMAHRRAKGCIVYLALGEGPTASHRRSEEARGVLARAARQKPPGRFPGQGRAERMPTPKAPAAGAWPR